jgi:carbon storage regulator
VLTRKIGESLIIGENIKVEVMTVENGRVRLGVECDKSISVHRGEVWEQIKEVRKPE